MFLFFFIIDKLIGYKLYFCRNERKEIFFVKKNTTDNTVFFDIGANIGIYTQMVASSFDKIRNSTIIAIEPDPLNCFRIKQNLGLLEKKIPNIFNQVKIEECGVGDFSGEKYLDKSKGPANNTIIDSYEKNSIYFFASFLNYMLQHLCTKYTYCCSRTAHGQRMEKFIRQ